MKNEESIKEWTALELSQCLEKCVLIDVRGADEYTGPLSHVEPSKLITLGVDLDRFLMDSRESLKDTVVVFICRSGVRSMRAAEQAKSLGYKSPINLKGGMIAWNEACLPVAKKGSDL